MRFATHWPHAAIAPKHVSSMPNETDISHDLHIDLSTDSRETFIPLRHNDLFLRLIRRFEMPPSTADSFRSLFEQLQSIFHVEHLSALLRIEDLYSPFDPECLQIELTVNPVMTA